MFQRMKNRILVAALVAALMAGAIPASAATPSHLRPVAQDGVAIWTWLEWWTSMLVRATLDAGSSIDPLGDPGSSLDAGPRIDPLGNPGSSLDAGPLIDPLGIPGSSLDAGPLIDPNGNPGS